MKSTRDIFIATSALRCKLALLLVLVIALAWPAMTWAATQYWDTSTTSGYQIGNGDWGTSSDWTINATTLETWTNGNSANFNGSGISVVTVNSPVSATGSPAVAVGNAPGNGTNTTVFFSGSSTLTSAYFGVGWANNGNNN